MRIGIFSESYVPIVNGVSVSVCTLRDELAKRGHDVFVFAPGFNGYRDDSISVFRFPSAHTPFMRDYPFPLPFAPELCKKFGSLDLDVVHTQTPFILGILGEKWARRHGLPLVSTNHTLYTEYSHYVPLWPKHLTRSFLVNLMRWYYSKCDAVVVPSKPVEDTLRSYGLKSRVEVIKTGVDAIAPSDKAARLETRKRLGIAEGDFLLLYVGRMAKEKNLYMLLEAFKRVSDNIPNARLLMVGGGPALDDIKQRAGAMSLSDNVIFAGMLKRNEIEPIYCCADAFVFPSTTETQGIAICEAMSAGLPIVAANAGGIPENVEHGVDGFLTNDDPQEFASRIEYLIKHETDRTEMGRRAAISAQKFSVAHMVDNFEMLYASVIDAKTRGALV